MRKQLLSLLAIVALTAFVGTSPVFAQEEAPATEEAAVAEAATDSTAAGTADAATASEQEFYGAQTGNSLIRPVKKLFVDGGPTFMSFVLACLIFGLALAIERIIYLSMASTNNKKLVFEVEDALAEGGIDAAKEVCRNTQGPVASIFYQGLDRYDEGIDNVEKSVVAYGGVQAALLEKGLSWIQLFIALAPMLGFMGTVLGMIAAFDSIKVAGTISPALVADGISVALITTVSGLVVAMILQVFYNYILAKIDGIILKMEDASISLVDILVKHSKK